MATPSISTRWIRVGATLSSFPESRSIVQHVQIAICTWVCMHALPCWKSAPKCTRIDLRFKNFLEVGHAPDPPSRCITQLAMARSSSQRYISRFFFINCHRLLHQYALAVLARPVYMSFPGPVQSWDCSGHCRVVLTFRE